MPELPEVETTVRAIRPFENTILKKIIIHNRNLRWQVDENLEDLVLTFVWFIEFLAKNEKSLALKFESQAI